MATDHELVLYVMTGCPYCIKVKRFLADNGVTIPERNISTDPDAEQTLIAVGGKRQVPCLFIDGKPLYESSDIIAWVQKNLLEHAHCGQFAPTEPNPYEPNMYASIQSRHFPTSLDADVQLFNLVIGDVLE